MIGLIENEIERDLRQRADMGEAPISSEEAEEHTEQQESATVSDCESISDEDEDLDESEDQDEPENMGMSMGM